MRLLSQPQSRTEGTSLDARDADKNPHIWNAKLIMATTGCTLPNFSTSTGPWQRQWSMQSYSSMMKLSKRQRSATLAILGALPRKCLVLRAG